MIKHLLGLCLHTIAFYITFSHKPEEMNEAITNNPLGSALLVSTIATLGEAVFSSPTPKINIEPSQQG